MQVKIAFFFKIFYFWKESLQVTLKDYAQLIVILVKRCS
jgi:hypothetical protein